MRKQSEAPAEQRAGAGERPKGASSTGTEKEKARRSTEEFDDGRPGSGGVRREDLSPDDFE